MTAVTLSNITKRIREATMSKLNGNTYDDLEEMLSCAYSTLDVLANHEAFEIVMSVDFAEVQTGELDFSDCKSALECVVYEANEVITSIANDVSGDIDNEIREIVRNIQNNEEVKLDGKQLTQISVEVSNNFDFRELFAVVDCGGKTAMFFRGRDKIFVDFQYARHTIELCFE